MSVKIERIDHQGRGIGYLDGKIVFVKNALPLEEVEIKITKSNSKILEADVTKYIKKSDLRIEEVCPYYGECGGCNLLHMSYDNQLKYKYNKVVNILEKYADISKELINPIVSESKQFGYRNKVTLKVDNKVGYFKDKTNTIVHIEKCLLLNDKINEIISYINNYGNINGVSEIVIKSMSKDENILILYAFDKNNYVSFVDYIKKFIDNIVVVYKNNIIYNCGKSNIIARLNNKKFNVNPLSFFQVNINQTINLYDKIADYVKKMSNSILLDLYCGTGSIGQYLSEYLKEIIGVEIVKEAILNARQNANMNKIKNTKYYVGDTKDILKDNKFKVDIVIVDPPRAGLDKTVVDDLLKINSKSLIYVSCDPLTLARDIKILKNNYEIKDISLFDMFPNTYHVETVCIMERK